MISNNVSANLADFNSRRGSRKTYQTIKNSLSLKKKERTVI